MKPEEIIQSEFSWPSWITPGVFPQGEILKQRISVMLAHESISEKSNFLITNPTLRSFINDIFHKEQFLLLYRANNISVSGDIRDCLMKLDSYAGDSLKRAIDILKKRTWYDTLPPFQKLIQVQTILDDSQESNIHDEIGYWAGKKKRREKVVI